MLPINLSGGQAKCRVIGGDCRDRLIDLAAEGVQVDACITDPPYHLASIVARFGARTAKPAQVGRDGAFRRAAAGFMGKTWDGGGIAQDPDLWRWVGACMKPGAYLVAFGGTRTYHRQACAIEDAGFEIRDSILHLTAEDTRLQALWATLDPEQRGALQEVLAGAGLQGMAQWCYATGMPKSHDVGQQLVKAQYPDAARYLGLGTALKPAWEPIVLARWPLGASTVARNTLQHGTGALQLDRARIGAEGRWPSNLVHDGSPEVEHLFPDSAGQLYDQAPGIARRPRHVYGAPTPTRGAVARQDRGSAARFHHSGKAAAQDRVLRCLVCGTRTLGPPACGCSRESGESSTSSHPTVKPQALLRWLCRLVVPQGGLALDPFAGSGSLGTAARDEGMSSILIEREPEYVEDIQFRLSRRAK